MAIPDLTGPKETTAPANDIQLQQSLFARKATGLVKGWSPFDGFVYAFFACNIVLGFWVMSFAPLFPDGSLFWAIVIAVAFVMFEVIVYAGLVSAMPRAGGDYVWQTRILNGPIGFVLAATGWWFILCHWVPIYAKVTVISFFAPVLRTAGAGSLADSLGQGTGLFICSMIVIGLTTAYVSMGMKGYARVQRITFYLGMIGLAVAAALLLFSSKAGFISAFNREAADMYGFNGDAYAATLAAGGDSWKGAFSGSLKGTFLLVPMLLFWLLWPNWGATLAGEVRGSRDFKKNVLAMGAALVAVAAIGLAFIALISKTMGWNFFMAASNGYWTGKFPLNEYPSPITLAGWLVNNPILQIALVTSTSMLVLGWYGTAFLSSTRTIFALAFDRILPDRAASVSPRTGTPNVALALMVIPSIVASALYCYSDNFARYTLDATVVIAITFLGTTIAATIMPWRSRRVFEASPLSKWKIAGIPTISIAGTIFALFLTVNLYLWLTDDVYGVNNTQSLIYMGALYLLAIVIYIVATVVRRRQGMGIDAIQREIPVE